VEHKKKDSDIEAEASKGKDAGEREAGDAGGHGGGDDGGGEGGD